MEERERGVGIEYEEYRTRYGRLGERFGVSSRDHRLDKSGGDDSAVVSAAES